LPEPLGAALLLAAIAGGERLKIEALHTPAVKSAPASARSRHRAGASQLEHRRRSEPEYAIELEPRRIGIALCASARPVASSAHPARLDLVRLRVVPIGGVSARASARVARSAAARASSAPRRW